MEDVSNAQNQQELYKEQYRELKARTRATISELQKTITKLAEEKGTIARDQTNMDI